VCNAINFNDNKATCAIEIDDIIADDFLTIKVKPFEFPTAQLFPQ